MSTSRLVAPSSDPLQAPFNSASTAVEASRQIKAGPGNLYWLTCVVGASSGWLLLFDALSVPVDGTVTPRYAVPVSSDGTNGYVSLGLQPLPMKFSTGILAVFSTTGPFSKTASATAAFFSGYM